MKCTTFRMLGGAAIVTLASEAAPHVSMIEDDCVPTAEEIILCGPSAYLPLERRQLHVPEEGFDAYYTSQAYG